MSNESKKGKFNIVDLVILVVILLALGFVAVKLLHIGGDRTPLQKVRITYYEEECPDFVLEHTKLGDTLMDGKENNYIGTLVDMTVDSSRTYYFDEDTQENLVGTKEGYSSVMLVGETEGVMTPNGVIVGGELYAPGHSMVLYVGMAKYFLTVFDITPVA